MNWKKSMRLSPTGGNVQVFSESKCLLANGYVRIVFGGRGPYVEFDEQHILMDSFFVPDELKYRIHDGRVYYTEYRSICPSYVKLYHQKKTVTYADYKIGKYYISPRDSFDSDRNCFIVIPKNMDDESEVCKTFFSYE